MMLQVHVLVNETCLSYSTVRSIRRVDIYSIMEHLTILKKEEEEDLQLEKYDIHNQYIHFYVK